METRDICDSASLYDKSMWDWLRGQNSSDSTEFKAFPADEQILCWGVNAQGFPLEHGAAFNIIIIIISNNPHNHFICCKE